MSEPEYDSIAPPARVWRWFGQKYSDSGDKEITKKKKHDQGTHGYHRDPNMHTGIVKLYLTYASRVRDIIHKDGFNYFIISVICVAGVNVGIQSYEEMDDILALDVLDNVILIVFSLEIILKIIAEGLAPMLYFIGDEWKWNTFDFSIVFMSLPLWNGLFGGGSLALLRLVRLMRLAKIIKKIPALQVIVHGLVGGLASIGYILLLLILVLYMFAVAGVYMFRSNDPFHFGTLPIALMTMFRCSTLDAWSDVMFLNIFGCDGYSYLYVSEEEKDESNKLFWCRNPKKQFVLSASYFVFFVVVSALVMLSLFIGAVTLSMNDSLNELKRKAEEKKMRSRFEKNINKLRLASSILNLRTRSRVHSSNQLSADAGSSNASYDCGQSTSMRSDISPSLRMFYFHSHGHPMARSLTSSNATSPNVSTRKLVQGDVKSASTDVENNRGELRLGSAMSERESPTSIHLSNASQDRDHVKRMMSFMGKHSEFSFRDDEVSGATLEKSSSLFNLDPCLPEWYKKWREDQTALASLNQRIEIGRLLRIGMGVEPHGIEDDPKSLTTFIKRLIEAEKWSQSYEILVEHSKYISEHSHFVNFVTAVIVIAGINVGVQTDERITGVEEIYETSVVLDKFILSVFTFECVLKILAEGYKPWVYFSDNWNKFDFIIVVGSYTPGAGSLLTMLRLLRLLRVLKLVKSLPQLAVIVNALLMGMSSIGYIGMILFLCFYAFAILGMLLFRDNDPFHFGNLHISMFTLFRCSTLDDWTEIMYVNLYGCDRYPGVYEDFPEMCDKPNAIGIIAPLYFNIFILVGAQILLTLFIGVITTSMEQAQEIKDRDMKLERQCKSLKNSLDLTDVQMKCFRRVFKMLDDGVTGILSEADMAVCFESIEELLYPFSIEDEIRKADPEGRGVDLVTLIVVICNLPSCKYKRLLRRTLRRWIVNRRARGLLQPEKVSVRQVEFNSSSSDKRVMSIRNLAVKIKTNIVYPGSALHNVPDDTTPHIACIEKPLNN
mmetsp:Transcript_398/g.745  ORF Transcript_398/g.745 Transcript_398/m.745 type:complete len:1004 (+) Transcript_398:139-3150(+)